MAVEFNNVEVTGDLEKSSVMEQRGWGPDLRGFLWQRWKEVDRFCQAQT